MSQITQRGATGPFGLTANGTFQTSTDASLQTLLGTRWDTSDGREVALGLTSSATAAVAGDLYQNAAVVANHQGLTVTAVQAYSNSGNTPATVTVTLGATALTANQYQGGFLTVDSGTGIGQTLRIAENPAAVLSATGVVITLEDGPALALTTSSVVSLWPAVGYNVIISPTTPTNSSFGVALYAVPASTYGYFLTKGFGAVLSDSTAPAVGNAVMASKTTAGSIAGVSYAGNVLTGSVIGYTAVAAVSASAKGVFLNI
jgi:hypothetical protein